MSAQSTILFLSALLATASALSTGPTVWGSVAMIMHGERTPLRGVLSNDLTPLGAQQMYAQGNAFRIRYLSSTAPTNASESRITSRAAIKGIARNGIEHQQLSILSLPDAHIAAGAIAFMQGLYPPITQVFPAEAGGTNISYSTFTGNSTQYPLDGYQYPRIETLGESDERSVYIRGNTDCPQWQISTQHIMRADPYMHGLYESSYPTYQALFTSYPLNDGAVSPAIANFWDAYNIYDYVRYRYSHEQPIHDAMQSTYVNTSEFLAMYARQQQLNMTSNQAVSGLKRGDMIRTIAGRTLARKVVDALEANGRYDGYSNKMTLMFSSQEPFLSFFSLAKLQSRDPTLSNPFWDVPDNGAAMVFELIGDQPNRTGAYPTEDNLYIRFLYRENAAPDTPFREHSLFGRSDSDTRVTYGYFKQEMLKFGVDFSDWCAICNARLPFCERPAADTPKTIVEAIRSAVQKPFVAGIIGAVIVLAVLGLVVLAGGILGGFRIRRTEKKDKGEGKDKDGPTPGLGGFKAAEKMASDPDLSVSSRGVRHERQGSWELCEGRIVATGTGAVADKSWPNFQAKAVDADDDDDAASVMGASPVKPREGV
ncbi:hypothetical protein EsH8_II_000207 [Colletotrichum jinshuiense]